MADLGWAIEMMERIIARDRRTDLTPEVSEIAFRAEAGNAGFIEESPLFDRDNRLHDIVRAINRMSPFEGQLLVLRHVEGLALPTLAGIYELTPRLIRTALTNAEHEFVEALRGLSWDHAIEPDVHALLTGLAKCIDGRWAKDVAEGAMQYLAQHRW